ncbi:Gfo/Idh/MocA family oxidoreductase [Pseudomonas fluorescens]|uniref:Gfo/Idh/MocA family oxidoreductase n=1 Tax=Pseudomonas fluorescens TaxID=294 RepID=A0A944DF44_PSEFL|nr:Gfo/Idh/MocA family oxidoreductase [Pseudomonas fluorescens]MBT2297496.1 Gfo/Idh/MocA family oxidoreductase [Pseudomonas fluorescens]MBT2305694.1 Gfo/Idh/MocA family oxidoreductase [Pseudomonas fluorescens]MBT2314283.1 Gfo/Idh/MocA family oxidoreductase [Pseudomonas fluorescens]MBT2319225.1 Gfo/Idh/MocA family oxidoreductase [Pseudomonas fluorescens]MBT2328502.1 Gfo/Idh/MocA family oxidoreductase [Pseudomonas fluorescens]
MSRLNQRKRVVVAGTAFGRIYLQALARAHEDYELVGILSRGNAYSRACADHYGVALYHDVEQLPDDIDIACVVVRSGATGGAGSELAQGLLRRGIHVLQEHPVHHREIAACMQAARQGQAAYAVNTLYPNILAIRRFLAVARYLGEQQGLAYIDASCNSQVAYPLLDILGRLAGGLRPWAFAAPAASVGTQPFTRLNASFNGVPVSLRIQNQVHPQDPDNHSFLLHRLEVGCEAGVLSLGDTHGPVLWNPRLHAPRDSTDRLIMAGPGSERLAGPTMVVLDPQIPGTYHQVFNQAWPDAVIVALGELCRDIERPARRLRSGVWATEVSMAWREMNNVIGMPELIEPPVPRALPLDELRARADAEQPPRTDDSVQLLGALPL